MRDNTVLLPEFYVHEDVAAGRPGMDPDTMHSALSQVWFKSIVDGGDFVLRVVQQSELNKHPDAFGGLETFHYLVRRQPGDGEPAGVAFSDDIYEDQHTAAELERFALYAVALGEVALSPQDSREFFYQASMLHRPVAA